MQCIFIVNNNIQKKRKEEKKERLSFTEKNKRFWGGDKENKQNTNTNQTLPKDKETATTRQQEEIGRAHV